jgi:hypothetical protein
LTRFPWQKNFVKRRIAFRGKSIKMGTTGTQISVRSKIKMKVRTNLYSGEATTNPVEAQLNQCFQTILGLVQTANQVVNNSLTNPEALNLFTKTNTTTSL